MKIYKDVFSGNYYFRYSSRCVKFDSREYFWREEKPILYHVLRFFLIHEYFRRWAVLWHLPHEAGGRLHLRGVRQGEASIPHSHMVRTIIEYVGTMNAREINAHRTNIESICASEAFKEVYLVKERNFWNRSTMRELIFGQVVVVKIIIFIIL